MLSCLSSKLSSYFIPFCSWAFCKFYITIIQPWIYNRSFDSHISLLHLLSIYFEVEFSHIYYSQFFFLLWISKFWKYHNSPCQLVHEQGCDPYLRMGGFQNRILIFQNRILLENSKLWIQNPKYQKQNSQGDS